MTENSATTLFDENMMLLKDQYHPGCIFNTDRFDIRISFSVEGELTGCFYCHEQYQGYPGSMHGGMLSALIDCAMTRCLFGHRIIAYTGRLNIKFSHPVLIKQEMVITVRPGKRERDRIQNIKATIFQDGRSKITAEAKFWIEKDLNTYNCSYK